MNLSKQEFLNTGGSDRHMQDKRKLRAELARHGIVLMHHH